MWFRLCWLWEGKTDIDEDKEYEELKKEAKLEESRMDLYFTEYSILVLYSFSLIENFSCWFPFEKKTKMSNEEDRGRKNHSIPQIFWIIQFWFFKFKYFSHCVRFSFGGRISKSEVPKWNKSKYWQFFFKILSVEGEWEYYGSTTSVKALKSVKNLEIVHKWTTNICVG